MSLFQIEAPFFVAGIVCDEDRKVALAAPIIGYMEAWKMIDVFDYVRKRGWVITELGHVHEKEQNKPEWTLERT